MKAYIGKKVNEWIAKSIAVIFGTNNTIMI
jgi:hypothetical protein